MVTKKTDHEDAKSMKLKLQWVSKNGRKEKLMREKNRWTEVETKIEAKKQKREAVTGREQKAREVRTKENRTEEKKTEKAEKQ